MGDAKDIEIARLKDRMAQLDNTSEAFRAAANKFKEERDQARAEVEEHQKMWDDPGYDGFKRRGVLYVEAVNNIARYLEDLNRKTAYVPEQMRRKMPDEIITDVGCGAKHPDNPNDFCMWCGRTGILRIRRAPGPLTEGCAG